MHFEIPPFFLLIGLMCYVIFFAAGIAIVGLLWGNFGVIPYLTVNIAPWAFILYRREEIAIKLKQSPGGFLGTERQHSSLDEYIEKYGKKRDNED